MTESVIIKRLHIAGLTPALTADDISQRLSSFGTVKAVDGFGLLDGVGQPRKFGFVTIETTPTKFARCCNLLSGTTWKGAKLRIGEATPDFRERIAAENAVAKQDAESAEEIKRARKARKMQKYGAVHAQDMSLVTKENAHERPGWVVTPLGRIVRPMKMRPLKPLTDVDAKVSKGKEPKKQKSGTAEVRARRRRIDMLKYGSVHLKGVFVDMVVPNLGLDLDNVPSTACKEGEPSRRSEVVDGDEMEIDEPSAVPGEDDEGSEDHLEESESGIEDEVMEEDYSEVQAGAEEPTNKESTRPPTAIAKLKDLFVPQDENEGFSLLGHLELDLDLELDEDVPFPIVIEEPVPQTVPITETMPITIPTTTIGQSRSTRTTTSIQLDPRKPLFFPLPMSSTAGPANRRRQRDPFDVAKEKGWNWRDPSVAFYRTETEDEIRNRWEESKGELTREWKRRWKEAGKLSRRKHGGVRVEGE